MAEWQSGQMILGEYQVERELGRGGMGSVWLVKSTSTGHQFAVKQALLNGERHRKAFLAELQTWIDLPEHPNLVPCRFFRTTGDEVLIFAEYVDGKSLKEWIDTGRLYKGGPDKALKRILDVAIQFAWALHCVHELGLVHQDVKPGNVLMATADSVTLQGMRVRVTDYGLARAKAAAGETGSSGPRTDLSLTESMLVSYGGCTPAYCSPEQAAGRLLTKKTDIWSWGVSVLEMFTGGVTWQSGRIARSALEDFTSSGEKDPRTPTIPESIVEILKGCFMDDPEKRWPDIGMLVERLKTAYFCVTGGAYARDLEIIEHDLSIKDGVGERQGRHGAGWADPKVWLACALEADGRDKASAEKEASDFMVQAARSRRGKLVAEIAGYDYARQIYERLIKTGRSDLENALAGLCTNAATVHSTADDAVGAVALFERSIKIRERLVNLEGRHDLADALSGTYISMALLMSDLGDNRTAIPVYDQAIGILERLVNQEGRRELTERLANAYMNKANSANHLGDNRAAIALYDQAIEIQERLVNQESQRKLDKGLVKIYTNKAIAVKNLGDYPAAIVLYDRAIEIQERLVNQEGRWELADMLATIYVNKAVAVNYLDDNRAAVALYDKAIGIWERLVNQDGRRELAEDLAMIYSNKALAVRSLGDNRAEIALYDQTLLILERLVNQEGRRDLANRLAMTYMNKGSAVMSLGDNRAAIALFDQSIKIRGQLMSQEGRRDLSGDHAWVQGYRAISLIRLGEIERGRIEAADAVRVLREEIQRTGRSDLKRGLGYIENELKG